MSGPKSASGDASSRTAKRPGPAPAKKKIAVLKTAKDKSESKAGSARKTERRASIKTISGARTKNTTWKLSYLDLYRASPIERISLIRKGIPASAVKQFFVDLDIGQGVGFKSLNLSTATVNKKAKNGDVLSTDESERIIGFARLVGQLAAIIQESGDHTGFDAPAWMAQWLTEPLPAFGGLRPADLIDTMEGQGLVSSALAKLQSGAYA